ncbi:hypothetical protein HQ545_07125 [Candidatus Woesearchaeota archaeon]|nr:hypothetical protein [Candidatus Woesearchaeota archaeon]
MADKDIILKNFNEYYEMAEYAMSKQKYNTAVTLFYKALVELCDLELIRSEGRIGANHTERFNLLKTSSPKLYSIASKLFRFYRDSYNKEISSTVAGIMSEEVKNAKRICLNDH